MISDADQLARLRVAIATGRLPHDVGRWALGCALQRVTAAERRAQRDQLLRAAGDRIGGSTYTRAKAILAIIHMLDEYPGLKSAAFSDGTPEALVQMALHLPAPRTLRRLLSILAP